MADPDAELGQMHDRGEAAVVNLKSRDDITSTTKSTMFHVKRVLKVRRSSSKIEEGRYLPL